MATASEIRQAAIRDAEANIRAVLGNLYHQFGVDIQKVTVLVQPSTFEVKIEGR